MRHGLGWARGALAALAALLLTACETTDMEALAGVLGAMGAAGGTGALTQADATAGLREALTLGTAAAVTQVARTDGYLGDAQIRIPLPGFLGEAQEALQPLGMSGLFDELEAQINRGAEAAAPQAQALFVNAVRQMTVADAIEIVRGPDDAATQYFRNAMTPQLRTAFRPIVSDALEDTGAMLALDQIQTRLRLTPFAAALPADYTDDLVDYGVERALDGLFFYVAEEEAAIRSDPAKRTSDLLRRVFGSAV